jgi:hypothetical protein
MELLSVPGIVCITTIAYVGLVKGRFSPGLRVQPEDMTYTVWTSQWHCVNCPKEACNDQRPFSATITSPSSLKCSVILSGLVVSILAIGPKACGFKPGRGQ